jgi:hypothetical protein
MQPNAASPDPHLGNLLYTRKHTALSHTIGAAFILLLPTIVLSSIVLFTKQNPGVEPMSLGEKLAIIGFIVILAGAAGLYLFLKGLKGRMQIEAYDRGIRVRYPNRDDIVFTYDHVRQLKRRIFNGLLASVEFDLTDGTSHTLHVHSSADAQMLNEILARYGNIPWQPDNTFRIM